MPQQKRCNRCERQRPMTEFTPSRPSECKECIAWRNWKRKYPEAIKEEWLKQYQANVKRQREREELKAQGKKRCCDCYEIKALEEFSAANLERGIVQSYCKPCFAKMLKELKAGTRKPRPKVERSEPAANQRFNVATLRM